MCWDRRLRSGENHTTPRRRRRVVRARGYQRYLRLRILRLWRRLGGLTLHGPRRGPRLAHAHVYSCALGSCCSGRSLCRPSRVQLASACASSVHSASNVVGELLRVPQEVSEFRETEGDAGKQGDLGNNQERRGFGEVVNQVGNTWGSGRCGGHVGLALETQGNTRQRLGRQA